MPVGHLASHPPAVLLVICIDSTVWVSLLSIHHPRCAWFTTQTDYGPFRARMILWSQTRRSSELFQPEGDLAAVLLDELDCI